MRRLVAIFALILFPAIAIGPGEAAWYRAESETFVMIANLPEDELRDRVTNLALLDRLLRRNAPPTSGTPAPKLSIFVLEDRSRPRSHFATTTSGYYRPSLRGPATVAPAEELVAADISQWALYLAPDAMLAMHRVPPQQFLFNEYSRHFMLQNFPASYPQWYVEAFAEFYSTAQFPRDGQVEIGAPLQYHVPALDEYGEWEDYADLLAEDASHNIFWRAQEWLLVHYAAFHPPVGERLAQYLTAMQQGASARKAYQQSFASADWNLLSLVRRYYRNGGVPVATASIDLGTPEIQITNLSDREAETALLRAPFNQDGTDFRALAERHSDDAQILAEYAGYLIEQGRYAEAIATGERAVGADANNVDASLFLGTALIAAARESGNDADARWERGRSFLLAANHGDPYNPMALFRYFQSFPGTDAPPEAAQATLEQAFRFVPQNPEVRLALAVEFLGQLRFDEARLLVLPITRQTIDTERRELAERISERIEARDANVADLRRETTAISFAS